VSTGDRDTELPPPSVNFLLKKGGGKSVPLAPVDVRDNYLFVDIDGIADHHCLNFPFIIYFLHLQTFHLLIECV
jgi:hypothetical protein